MHRDLLWGILLLLPGLAGCAREGDPSFVPGPIEAFEATYEYWTQSGGRHGTVDVRLEGPLPILDTDLRPAQAYVLSGEWPNVRDIEGGPVRHQRWRVAFDADLEVLRVERCILDASGCNGTRVWWPHGDLHDANLASYRRIPFGYGLPALSDAGAIVENGDGTFDINHYRYRHGRLLPEAIGNLGMDPSVGESYRLVRYEAGGRLAPAGDWTEAWGPPANESYPFQLFPDEDVDVLGLGWTAAQAFDHVRAAGAASVLGDGGCFREFTITADVRTDDPSSRVVDHVRITVQDKHQQGHVWSFWYERRGPSLQDPQGQTGFTIPERDAGWPFPYNDGCDRVGNGPPVEPLGRFLERVDPWVPLEGALWVTVTSQPPDPGHGGYMPSSFGFQYDLWTLPRVAWTTTSALGVTPPSEPIGDRAGAEADAWSGRIQWLSLPADASPP